MSRSSENRYQTMRTDTICWHVSDTDVARARSIDRVTAHMNKHRERRDRNERATGDRRGTAIRCEKDENRDGERDDQGEPGGRDERGNEDRSRARLISTSS